MPKIRLRAKYFVTPSGEISIKENPYIPTQLVMKTYELYDMKCSHCGEPVRRGGLYDYPNSGQRRCGSIDHILPVSRGGRHELKNLRVLCKSCNCSRQAGVYDDF